MGLDVLQRCTSPCQHWLGIRGTILSTDVFAKQVVGFCINIVVIFYSNQFKRKYNAQDFDKSKSANLLKILKGEHPTKKWQNCGTEVLCCMMFYDGAELARVVNKVLGTSELLCGIVCEKS